MSLSVEVIRDPSRLQRLAGEWNGLLARSPADTIFLTWEWISSWLHAVQPSADLFVIAVRDERDALKAVAPLYRSPMSLLDLADYRCLAMLGGRFSGAEYPDFIIDPLRRGECLVALASALKATRSEWDCLWMPYVSGWRGARERVALAETGAGFHIQCRPCDFAVLNLPDRYDVFLESLSANTRSALRRHTRRIEAAGRLEFTTCRRLDELPEYLHALFDLHQRRWQSVGQDGGFVRKPLTRAFYETFAPVALRRGWLALHGLRIDGTLQAVQYGYVYKQAFLQLQEGFNPDISGLGNLLRARVIQSAIEAGIREYDFLGGFTDHKRRWGAQARLGHDLFILSRSLRVLPLRWGGFWPTGRFMRWHTLTSRPALAPVFAR